MSGSGGAPQLDEQALEAALGEVENWLGVKWDEPVVIAAAVSAYLAASPGGGELDLTDGEVEAVLRNLPDEPGFHLGFGGNFNAAVAKLRARLDRKDDEA